MVAHRLPPFVCGSGQATGDGQFNVFRDELPDRVVKGNNTGGYILPQLSQSTKTAAHSLLLEVFYVYTGEVMRVTSDTLKWSKHSCCTEPSVLPRPLTCRQPRVVCRWICSWRWSWCGYPIRLIRQLHRILLNLRTSFSVTGTLEPPTDVLAMLRTNTQWSSQIAYARNWESFLSDKNAENMDLTTKKHEGILNSIANVIDGATFSTPGQMTEDDLIPSSALCLHSVALRK